MRAHGFPDAVVTPLSHDEGVDVLARDAIAQVKAHMVPVTRPSLQQFLGAAASTKYRLRLPLFFAAAGYTADAVDWAAQEDIALFTFDRMGEVAPVNHRARQLIDRVAPPAKLPPGHAGILLSGPERARFYECSGAIDLNAELEVVTVTPVMDPTLWNDVLIALVLPQPGDLQRGVPFSASGLECPVPLVNFGDQAPCLVDGRLYNTRRRELIAVDLTTGDEAWVSVVSGARFFDALVVRGDAVFVASRRPSERTYAKELTLECWSSTSGRFRWSTPLGLPMKRDRPDPVPVLCAASTDVIYVTSEPQDDVTRVCTSFDQAAPWYGAIDAVDLLTGTRIWGHDDIRIEQLVATPFSAIAYLIQPDPWNRYIAALDARSGHELWRFDFFGLLSGAHWTPVRIMADGQVVWVSFGTLVVCLDAASGEVIWHYSPTGLVEVCVATEHGLYGYEIAEDDAWSLIAVDPLDGSLLTRRPCRELWMPKTVHEDKLYLLNLEVHSLARLA
jgi:outer membrane protein assembly factor BamB